MNRSLLRTLITILYLLFLTQSVWSAPGAQLEDIRHHVDNDKVRIVLDLSSRVRYAAKQQDDLLALIIDLDQVQVKPGLLKQQINSPIVSSIRFKTTDSQKTQIIVESRLPVEHKLFTLANPQRIVIDFVPKKENKQETEVAPGVRYTSWYKQGQAGPLNIHILDINPRSGYILEPVLIKQSTLGIDTLSQVILRSDVLAAVNASYFSPSGDIIGLLKMNDEVISSTTIARTALGITNEGKLLIDQVSYKGDVEIPDYQRILLKGVNEYRGENALVLYNRFFGQTTKTNSFGSEYTIVGGKVAAIASANSPIPADGFVLSAHGEAAKKLANLKIGDPVSIYQTLGNQWDQGPNVVGAGPMLIKDGNVFLTTKLEEFGSDVAGGRAPRTAVATTQDGRVLLVVVDGRQAISKGMSLLEMALFLRELGAVSAMNLDGGGSSQMIIQGRTVNKPSDGKERKIGNALAVVPVKLAI